MSTPLTEPVVGWAAGVPFTALPPSVNGQDQDQDPNQGRGPAPLIVAWHLMDAPRSDAAFAAALPLAGVHAWRVYLGMPLVGRRPVEGAYEAAQADPMLRYVGPVVRQATEEFPAALEVLRERFPCGDGPIGIVGGSLGGTVALNVLARVRVNIAAVALVNPAIRARTAVEVFSAAHGTSYPWGEQARSGADELDFVAHAALIRARDPAPALLVVSGEHDYPLSRVDATELVAALGGAGPASGGNGRNGAGSANGRNRGPERIRLETIPGLDHPLAEQPGVEPAPQTPLARVVDETVTAWFRTHLR
ncbi:alpha/beta hydrolase family protein [Parafrankia elaeagni]|uniref:alpha/beta hydrolase family protein n=1 Tax=Parafrankia elaeagni TaxID=222534 RepID=UPI00036AF3D0|nr:alpha/beta hydrolase [Parafrankia elaeagni]